MSDVRTIEDAYDHADSDFAWTTHQMNSMTPHERFMYQYGDLPLVGPAHSPVVLDDVTVEGLVDELIGSDFLGPTPTQGIQAAVCYILNRIGIAIPEGYGTVQREEGDCPTCEGSGVVEVNDEERFTENGSHRVWKEDCPDCGGTGKVPVITIICHNGYVPRDGGSIAFLAPRKKEE